MRSAAVSMLLALGAGVACAGQAEVRFVEPETFRDAGFGDIDIARTTDAIDGHLQALARELPTDQTLKIEVLDIDLAGQIYSFAPRPLRIVNGGADWPRIKLRYTLESGGSTLASGEETIADMNYTWQTGLRRIEGAYGYEFRLLDRWFASHFATAAARR